jgi:arylsulfatase A-like enzyme
MFGIFSRLQFARILIFLAPILPAIEAAARPNVVFIVSDNQRADTIGALGNEHIQTPNLDALVRRGCAFRHAYNMGADSSAVCLPSRTMFLTGRTLFHVPLDWMCEEAEATIPPRDIPTLSKTFKEAGYETLRTGKSGNGPRFALTEFRVNIVVPRSLNGSERHATNAIEFFGRQKADRPFLLYVAFAAPNDPHKGYGVAPQEFVDMYPPDQMPLPPNYLPNHPFDNGDMRDRDEMLAPFPRTEDEVRLQLAGYYSVISYMDQQIGRIVQALKDNGQYDNTIIVFASDHGLAKGSHGLMGMQNLYEHSVRVPLVFAGPGVPEGKTSDALVYLFDIFPTLCELAGVEIPEKVEGKSLVSIMQSKTESIRDSLFTAYKRIHRAVRDDRWKLIRYPAIDKTQLFDLKSDPHEMSDLAEDPSYASQVDEMMELLRRWQREVDDDTPLG